jgi:hypothetical protein
MKNRNVIFAAILSALVCFTLLPQVQATPDPGSVDPFNTADGDHALFSNTSGFGNSAFGWYALFANTDGSFNTAVGAGALDLNNGNNNTAVGTAALLLNTGGDNTAVGTAALENNTVDGNTATGAFALFANTTGGTLETGVLGLFDIGPNTAVGSGALENNLDASANTAVGYHALNSQVSGDVAEAAPHLGINTAVGFEALANLTGTATGQNAANTALGYQALSALTDGYSNVAIGAQAGGFSFGTSLTSGSNNIFIGAFVGPATTAESGHTYIGNISSTTVTDDPVYVDLSTGLLGHLSSSRRYKEDIKAMNNASEALYRLKPVTYRYKKDVDRTQRLDYGLIAEEVAKVDPSLAVRDGKGQIESVRYTAVNAMLLNEFLKEHKKVEQLQATVVQQQKDFQAAIATLKETVTAQLKEQAAQIQKVSAQLEVNKPAPQVVVNKP